MATLERILYPSNKFAVGAFMVVLVLVAILSLTHVTSPANLICIGVGIELGWFGHVLAVRHHKEYPTPEYLPWELSLKKAQQQLDNVRSF